MKRMITIALCVCTIFLLSACQFCTLSGEEMVTRFDHAVGKLGQSQITEDKNLIGMRENKEDTYTGTYTSSCNGNTGRDVVFGGASIEERTLCVSGYVHDVYGQATIRIRMNDEVIMLQCDEDGYFSTTLNCSTGGNYIMVLYENFTGTVELSCEYLEVI